MDLKKVSGSISPCPNDTFIFADWIENGYEGTRLLPHFLDIEELNRQALDQPPQLIKLSCGVLRHCRPQFGILAAGAALGFGCGPLVLKRKNEPLPSNPTILTPGLYTTANLLFERYFPDFCQFQACLFSDIESALLERQGDMGIIIHETRFSYDPRQLEALADLGELWEEEMRLPVPLGLIVSPLKKTTEREREFYTQAIRNSLHQARRNPAKTLEYCRHHAQDMREEVMASHIRLYVNEYSLDPGEEGLRAIETLLA